MKNDFKDTNDVMTLRLCDFEKLLKLLLNGDFDHQIYVRWSQRNKLLI